MLARFRDRSADEDGFTLLELIVVVLVIAILIAVAVPNFFAAKERAGDRAVQSNVRNAFVATRIWYIASQSYSGNPAEMESLEPSLDWTNTQLDDSADTTDVYLSVSGGDQSTVVVGGRTASGRCFFIKDVLGSSGRGIYYDVEAPEDGTCPTPLPSEITEPRW